MKKDIFIDGETGTTGLQVHEKLSKHPNVNVMSVDQSKRKDISYKKEMLAKSDVTFLCLPDEISVETVQIADELGDESPIIIDASTAHRTNPNWSYGLPELGENYRKNLTDYNLSFIKVNSQTRLGEFEKFTPAYSLVDFKINFNFNNQLITIQLNNIFDKLYYNHLSDIKSIKPESGRNFVVNYKYYIF